MKTFIVKTKLKYTSIERKIEIEQEANLEVFHEVLQIAFGWNKSHQHGFSNEKYIVFPSYKTNKEIFDEAYDESRIIRYDNDIFVKDMFNTNRTFEYVYDFGTENTVQIDLVEIVENSNNEVPRIIEGVGGMALEDVMPMDLNSHNLVEFDVDKLNNSIRKKIQSKKTIKHISN